MRRSTYTLAVVLALAAGMGPAPLPRVARAAGIAPQATLWHEVDVDALGTKQADRIVTPLAYRVFQLDEAALGDLLERAPLEFTDAAKTGAPVVLPIPMPDGSLQRFRIQESPVMEPELAARFPLIRTYVAQGVDDPAATARLDLTPLGFHAQILSPGGAVYVDPYRRGDTSLYTAYFKRDLVRERDDFRCLVEDTADAAAKLGAPSAVTGQTLRTYRLALACTGEYSAAVASLSGQPLSVDTSMAAITTSVNRVVGIYEVEVAVRMVLVANNAAIVYTNGGTDPYTNNSGSAMLSENQANVDQVIGTPNYDIGHVFSTGGGGVASLGVVCKSAQKARGVTGLSQPVGDGFDVDYVAHEMGHQYGGNHTFNGTQSNCAFNRNASTAYEPGSGSTIQAYAGICGSVNLQPHSDPYFHAISFDEIVAYTSSGAGNNCPVQTSTGNLEPAVDAGLAYTIPVNTPFELTAASASDPNGDALTYCWEELDLGPQLNNMTVDNGSSPIFRSFNPSASPTRVFPQVSSLVNNSTVIGEVLPTTNRTMTFRCTVRDNRAAGGGVAFDATTVTSTTSAGPFAVTAPNAATTWAGGSSQTVTWNVAGTSGGAVNTPNVSILLSLDGGLTFPVVLLASTTNDGSQSVMVPNAATSQARIKVKGAGNVFFDISNASFTITASATGGDSAGIYLGSSGTYFLRNANAPGGADTFFGYGPSPSAFVPLVGDWDGDHRDTPGLYDPSSGFFFLRNANGPGPADLVFSFGPGGAGIVPLKGDWNGDGVDTIGIYIQSSGFFFLRNTNAPGGADAFFGFGPGGAGFVPLAGDWNADLRDTVGLYDPSSGFFFLRNENTSGPAELVFSFGAAGATPLVGDWNLDGRDTVGIYLPASGFWFLRNTNGPGGADVAFGFGPAGATPIAGDWDGL
jgi:hypothetical protein